MMKGKVLKPPFGFALLIRGSFSFTALSIFEQSKEILIKKKKKKKIKPKMEALNS